METADDLLQFKDYTSVGQTISASSSLSARQSDVPLHSNQPAQISVNSLSGGDAGISGSASISVTNSTSTSTSTSGRQHGDALANLMYDINNPMPSGNMTSIAIENDNSNKVTASNNKNNPNNNNYNNNSNNDADHSDNSSLNNKKLSLLTLEYYQQFFNVDTYMVVERIVNSIIPKRAANNYLRSYIEINPDLYGPFWITVTLIFSIAISGNIANYLQYAKDDYEWRYNFHLVSYAATCIFIYVNLMPVILWLLFKYSLKPISDGMETESADYTPSLLTLTCIYGYSISIYIPVSILWVIQISILQWLLVITAALLSGSVLILIMTPALRNSKISLILVLAILAAHFLLAAGFMLYFFHVPSDSNSSSTNNHYSVSIKPSITSSSSLHLQEKVTEVALNAIKSASLASSSHTVKNVINSAITSK